MISLVVSQPFKLVRVRGAPVSDDELIADLRRVANALGKGTVGQKEYRRRGTYDDSTVTRRFGSWNEGLLKAGLGVANQVDLEDQELFDNMLPVFDPRCSEMAQVRPGVRR